MKRIYILFVLLFAISATSVAQRSIDLKCVIASPAPNATITSGTPFNLDVVVTNLGPDSLRVADSMTYWITINGKAINLTQGTPPQTGAYWNRWGKYLKVNDTMHITYPTFNITYSSVADSQKTICFNVLPNRKISATDTIADPAKTNNAGCVQTTWKKNPVSVEETFGVPAPNAASLYPNPANAEANFDIAMQYNGDVSVKVMDLAGRVVLSNDKGFMYKGNHSIKLNTESLQNGLYLYQVTMGYEVKSGKLMISK